VLREVEQGKRIEGRYELKGVDNVASGRQLKLGMAALRAFNKVGVTTPLHNVAVAIGHCYQPKIVTDFAGIHFIVNPHVQSCQSHSASCRVIRLWTHSYN
jgi:hypothetical protein